MQYLALKNDLTAKAAGNAQIIAVVRIVYASEAFTWHRIPASGVALMEVLCQQLVFEPCHHYDSLMNTKRSGALYLLIWLSQNILP